ncbi:Histone H4 transcription factor [Chionoecetes opilio]|uniref:Histone H4 transcription factor n=1 Tax=Chionoecetes opilio TaxID=41210 RepID=A0A8J4XNT2_CHIOP|nr:Histone H4 transcription factor [Chionoecetes opilio]
MTRKRKASEAMDESWDEEEAGHEEPDGAMLVDGLLTPTLVAHPSYKPQTIRETVKNSFQQPLDDAAAMGYMSEAGSEVVDDPVEEPAPRQPSVTHGSSGQARKRLSEAARLKKISIECEWNMCTTLFTKVEYFIAHTTDHLLGITDPVSSDGYLCYWRECDFACSTKEEMDRHVYFHAFHAKIKSIGLVLMEERSEKCILDSSGRNMIPEIPEFFQCLWEDCSVRFASAHDFYCHVLSHVLNTNEEPNTDKPFTCGWDDCTSSFRLRARLRDHARSHTQEKIVGCPNCGGIFASNTKFFDHCLRQIPLEAQQYQCSHCSRRYANERLLRDHVRHHINHYKCTECDMTVPNKSTLAAHMRYRHKKDKPHKCLQCGRGFTLLADVTRHLSVHSPEPVYSCMFQNCTYKARSVTALNRHIRLVHNGLEKKHYACHMCASKFSLGDRLTKHLIKIHNFVWPVGHTRFKYRQDEDGFYRLQTVRYESIELNQEMTEEEEEEAVDSPDASTVPASPASHSSQLTPREAAEQRIMNNEDGDNQDMRLQQD